MPNLLEVINKLKEFSAAPFVATFLQGFQSLDTVLTEEAVESHRKQLNNMLLNSNNETIAEIAYEGLLALAEFRPLNDRCPMTLEDFPIKSPDIYVSTGHHFDLEALIKSHNQRLVGSSGQKLFLNPIFREPFSPKDLLHIQTRAKECGFNIAEGTSEAEQPIAGNSHGFFTGTTQSRVRDGLNSLASLSAGPRASYLVVRDDSFQGVSLASHNFFQSLRASYSQRIGESQGNNSVLLNSTSLPGSVLSDRGEEVGATYVPIVFNISLRN